MQNPNETKNDSEPEPDTVMADGVSDSGGKKKKKKKKKISTADKLKAALQKETDAFKNSGAPFKYFLKRMDVWIRENSKLLTAYFRHFDREGEGFVSYEEFKSGMFDLSAPVTNVELHLICQLFDEDETEEIEYVALQNGLAFVRERELNYEKTDISPALKLSKREYNHCQSCKMTIWDGENFQEEYPRYFKVHFKLITFDNFKSHPGHFSATVPSHTSIATLLEIIRKRTSVKTTKLALFKNKNRSTSSMLPEEYTLADCNLLGGTINEPVKIELFYDYKVEFIDCPILMCDHYFKKDSKEKNKHTVQNKNEDKQRTNQDK